LGSFFSFCLSPAGVSPGVLGAMFNAALPPMLTRRHGMKIAGDSSFSVEVMARAVGKKVGFGSVKSAAKMNGLVVIFLDQVEKVSRVVEEGLAVGDLFVQVFPLDQPSTRVLVSNIPPFITDEFLSRELSRHGKLVSPIREIASGFKESLMKHIMSYRRSVYMILNDRSKELSLRFRVRVDDYNYEIYASSSAMKCFHCGEEGHTARVCSKRGNPAPAGPGGAGPSGAPRRTCLGSGGCGGGGSDSSGERGATAAVPDPQVVGMNESVSGGGVMVVMVMVAVVGMRVVKLARAVKGRLWVG